MGVKETRIQAKILIEASKLGARLFRNNVAKGWIGKHKKTLNGSILIEDPRRLNSGLCVGSSDLIGWTPIEITEDMLGKKIAVFTAVEVKTATGKVSDDQRRFLRAVEASGGLALVGRSAEDVRQCLADMLHRK